MSFVKLETIFVVEDFDLIGSNWLGKSGWFGKMSLKTQTGDTILLQVNRQTRRRTEKARLDKKIDVQKTSRDLGTWDPHRTRVIPLIRRSV